MTTLAFPSTVFPGPPQLALEIPPDWESVPAAGETDHVVLAALRPLPEDQFKANIIVTVDETFADHTVRFDLDGVEATAAHRREGTVGQVYSRPIDGLTFFGLDLSYIDDIAGTLLVSNLFGFLRRQVDGGLLRITVTATIGSADHTADYATVHQVIDGLRVTPAEGTVPLIADDADDAVAADGEG
ncbi:hypothetical protein BA895_18095 [Humibacillus sp. DSM 29435]|uniref:hypothetical protein n=1 Tax=Humibacillus sp. DSM 29435 TaxID=1869167 RepID=UPI000872E57D|nr:hypothetical protein [Humibacillus sp. DSM 29435]OFE17082.1 hypothetical protein BA895_18095 [Humibacillus sp. DSM 29435]